MAKKETRVIVAGAPADGGTVTISDEVLVEIAGTEAAGTNGVVMPQTASRRQAAPGVAVQVANQEATFHLTIGVQGGTRIPEVATALRERIASAVRAKTGYTVVAVNILVERVVFGEGQGTAG